MGKKCFHTKEKMAHFQDREYGNPSPSQQVEILHKESLATSPKEGIYPVTHIKRKILV